MPSTDRATGHSKDFYKQKVLADWRDAFPNVVSYGRFVELMPWSFMALVSFLKTCCFGEVTGISFIRQDPWVLPEPRDLNPLQLASPISSPGWERLRHLVIGSPDGVRSTIHTLHVLNYAEQMTGRQLIAIPPSGIVITPGQGEVFSYLIRHRPLG